MSRGDAVKGIFYHVVTKFYHSVMLKILFGKMMINQAHRNRVSIPQVRGYRPLDNKSVALHRISSRNMVFQKEGVDIIGTIRNLNNMAIFSNRLITKGLQK